MEYPRACQLFAEAADALAHTHRMGIIHRDIKPSNLMLSRAGRCKVTDFGLARHDDPNDPFTLSSETVGTPLYLAPEVAFQNPATERSDLYSLSGSLWFCLTGKPPFDVKGRKAAIMANVQSQLPDLSKIRPDLPKGLVEAITKNLAKDPEQRMASAEQFARLLRGYCVHAPTPNVYQNDSAELRQKLALIGGGVLLILIGVLGVAYLSGRPESSAGTPPITHAAASPPVVGMATPTTAQATPPVVAVEPIKPAAPQEKTAAAVAQAGTPGTAASVGTASPTQPAAPSAAPVAQARAANPAASAVILTTELARITSLANQAAPPTITVEGSVTVAQTSSTGKVFRLFFEAGDDRKSFHAIYFPNLYPAMENKFGGKHGANLSGKRVRITGKPSVYQGRPQIRIDSPDQVVVVTP
jgi:hypothetical protein